MPFWSRRPGSPERADAVVVSASHFEPSWNFGGYRGLSTAWWLYQLKGDEDAAELFTGDCTACEMSGWEIERKNF
ncbi:MAG: hypothetical protein ACOCVV_03115 [Marinobacter sp.]